MIIGAARVDLHVHASQSLKAKRGVVRSITQRLRNRFNVSVAEVDGQGTWQVAVLGLTAVGGEAHAVRTRLERAIDFIEGLYLAEVVAQEIEILATPLSDYAESLGDAWEGREPEDRE